jgi:hypothetical protein
MLVTYFGIVFDMHVSPLRPCMLLPRAIMSLIAVGLMHAVSELLPKRGRCVSGAATTFPLLDCVYAAAATVECVRIAKSINAVIIGKAVNIVTTVQSTTFTCSE